MSRRARWLLAAAAAPLIAIVPAGAANAHPLGNFTVNVYAGLVVRAHELQVDYVIDMAEIPAFQERASIDTDGNGQVDDREARSYARSACDRQRQVVAAEVRGRTLPLRSSSASVSFPAGAAGLSTLRLDCAWTAPLVDAHSLTWSDGSFAQRVGWHEVTAVGDRVTLIRSDVPRTSLSARLTAYPKDLLRSPLSQRTASLAWRDGGSPLATGSGASRVLTGATPLAADRASRWYTGLLAHRSVTFGFVLLSLLAAVLLGALHALSPGHGKTAMAAYLVASSGSRGDAARLGLTVTATHTAGVLALGVGIASATTWAPERLYPWLSLSSGLLIVGVGASLLRHRHDPHQHHHDHHADEHHHHAHEHEHRRPAGGLAAAGFAGGLVPSPSAVIVLLGALALHRAWLGLALVVAYGLGMAAMLMAVGLVVARVAARASARRTSLLPRLLQHPATARTVSACAVMAAGALVVGRSALQL